MTNEEKIEELEEEILLLSTFFKNDIQNILKAYEAGRVDQEIDSKEYANTEDKFKYVLRQIEFTKDIERFKSKNEEKQGF